MTTFKELNTLYNLIANKVAGGTTENSVNWY